MISKHTLAALVSMLLLACCATLPDVGDVIDAPDVRSPDVMGPHGELSSEQSRRIIERLERQSGSRDLLTRQAVILEEIAGTPLTAGNKATLLQDGEATYKAMVRAIQGARDHINVETFIFDDDEIGRRFADLFLKKQAHGIQMNVIYDSFGSESTPKLFFKRLRDSGVNVLEFNPLNPLRDKNVDMLTHRDHRKILIVNQGLLLSACLPITPCCRLYP